MSFPETVDEILDVSEDEGKAKHFHLLFLGIQVFFELKGKKTSSVQFFKNCAPFAFPRSCTANARYECLLSLCSVCSDHESLHQNKTDLFSLTFSQK